MDLVQLNDPGREETPSRPREDLRRRRPRAAATTEFGQALAALKIKQRIAAQWFCTSERHIRRWTDGTRKTPPGVMVTIRLMMAGKVGPADVELAAGLVINDSASPEPPAEAAAALTPVKINGAPVAPAPEPAETLAEKVCRLTGCRWPNGDPKSPNFFFCDRATVREPYCEAHHARAYLLRRPMSEARPAVAYGFRPGRCLNIAAPRRGNQDGARTLTTADAS